MFNLTFKSTLKSTLRISLLSLMALLIALGAGGAAKAQSATPAAGFPRTVLDGAGNKVLIAAQPMRIVSATLATDEMLLGILQGADRARITAITANAADPTQSNIVADAAAFPLKLNTPLDPEAVVAAKPDLVFVASYTDAGVLKQLRDAKLTVLQFANFNSVKDVEGNIALVGQAIGGEAAAAQLTQAMETRLNAIADAVKTVKKPLTVLYYGPDGYSDGTGSTIDEVITRAGGVNAVTAGGIKDAYPQLSDEFIVKQDPDVILLAGFNSYAPGFVDKFNSNPNFKMLKAVKNKRAVVANDAHVGAISQYIVLGVSDVAALLYPDVYSPATPAATMAVTMVATASR